ncbi:MAG: hypothetical protein ACR9NN_18685 [Nostochopsis sp.]
MTRLELKNHQVWRDLTEILETLDAEILVKEHLELCDYKRCFFSWFVLLIKFLYHHTNFHWLVQDLRTDYLLTSLRR